jgi:hypothetical protein
LHLNHCRYLRLLLRSQPQISQIFILRNLRSLWTYFAAF